MRCCAIGYARVKHGAEVSRMAGRELDVSHAQNCQRLGGCDRGALRDAFQQMRAKFAIAVFGDCTVQVPDSGEMALGRGMADAGTARSLAQRQR